jgi:ferredoxin
MTERLRVVVDRDECFSFGVCVATLPRVFAQDEEGKAVVKPFEFDEVDLETLRSAVDGCPRGALTLVDEKGGVVWP